VKNEYLELKKRHQAEIDNFPMFFAFSNEQFNDGMEKFGLDPKETDKVCSIYGGGYVKKEDADRLKSMFLSQSKEKKQAIENDETGEGYIKDMFEYELANHEYNYTMDASDTLECLGLTIEDIANSQALQKGFMLAGGSWL